MKNPLVTIKCVVYNEAKYVRKTLEGFVMQKTNFPFLAIVHDDASTDGTQEIIREFEKKYPQIIKGIYEKTGNNLFSRHILDAQMNTWIFETGSKYIAMCEGDDWWIDDCKLQKQVDYMEEHPECVLCFTDCHTANEKSEISTYNLLSKHLTIPTSFEEHLFNAGYIAPPTWLYRSDASKAIGSYDAYTDDTFAMALDLFQQGEIHYMDEVTAIYTVRQGSVANQQNIKKYWNYVKGIGETQLLMADKYDCTSDIKERLLFQRYITDMLLAVDVNDDEYVQNALIYFEKKGYVLKWFVESCKDYVRYKKQYNKILSSRAYRLGKFLLKPFSMLRKMIKK